MLSAAHAISATSANAPAPSATSPCVSVIDAAIATS
jgi:hypothetical protein